MRNFALLILLLAPLAGFGQSLATLTPQQCVWHAGDDPYGKQGWAGVNVNETGWTALKEWDPPPTQPRNWLRCHLTGAQLKAIQAMDDPHLALEVGGGYQLFFQGRQIGSFGNLSTGDYSEDDLRSYALPRKAEEAGTIALRLTFRDSGPVLGHLAVGSPDTLAGYRARYILDSVRPILPYVIGYSIAGILGLLPLGLFYYDRDRRDLLWLGLLCIGTAMLRVNALCFEALVDYPVRVQAALWAVGNLGFLFEFLFFFALAGRRMPWWIWMLAVAAVSIALPHGLTAFFSADTALWLSRAEDRYNLVSDSAWLLANVAPFVAFWPWAKLSPRLRPLAVCCCLLSLSDAVYYAARVTDLTIFNGRNDDLNDLFTLLFNIRAFITVVVLLALLWLLFRDQRRIVEERAQLAGELEAAREIQQRLVPSSLPTLPGLQIAAAYLPAAEVGGDFYQLIPQAGGAALIVIGDVSGKGLKAAMTGVLTIGALRALAAENHSPAALMTRLNQQIVGAGNDGFVTCIVASLDGDLLTVANAGHLAPYLNGKEIVLDNGLPLGLAANAVYAETRLTLSCGPQLTFMTDGVVEAQSPNRELFGFDRTAAISTQSAEAIAEAAQHFGQEDDITVLTVTLTI